MVTSTDAIDVTSSPAPLLHYQLGPCLGEGGFGQVFEAWDNQLCRKVAIKRLKDITAGTDLLKEARIAASLRHPAFVKIHAFENIENSQSIVMELIEGKTLRESIKETSFTPEQAIEKTKQIAWAMIEAHQCGLVHGDLKPSNIMCDASGNVRILDFGLANNLDQEITTSLLQLDPLGTIAYMAPERLQNAPLSYSIDIYALGVILYEMLTGARPYPQLTGLALAAKHLQSTSDHWAWPEHISPEYIHLIKAMTASPAEQRMASMKDVLDYCERIQYPAIIKLAHAKKRSVFWGSIKQWHWILFIPVLIIALTLGIRLLKPTTTILPFSEAAAMQQGLHALNFYERPGELEAAEQYFKEILTHNPNHAGAAAGLSLTYSYRYTTDAEDEAWFRKAEAAAQRALQLNDQLALSHVAYAKVLDEQGKWDQALETLDKAMLLNPNDKLAMTERINTLTHAHRYEDALQLAMQKLQQFPQERFFADAIGRIHYIQGNFAAAEQAFRQSINMEPDVVYAYANLNATLMAMNRPTEALQVLQQGLQVGSSAHLYNNLGNTLVMQNDYLGAATAFESSVSPIKGNPRDYQNWINLGDVLQLIPGREPEARNAFKKARQLLEPRLKRAPHNSSLITKFALVSAKAGEKSGIEDLLSRALLLAPENAQIYLDAGVAYELIGHRKKAIEVIHQAMKLGYPESFVEAELLLTQLRRDPAFKLN